MKETVERYKAGIQDGENRAWIQAANPGRSDRRGLEKVQCQAYLPIISVL